MTSGRSPRSPTRSSDVSDGDAGDGKAPPANPLDALTQLFGAKSGPSTNPLGTLGLLIDFDGMTSVSSTDYDGSTVVATATSRIGELRLLAGLIKLNGVNVVTKVTSTLDGGAKTSQTVDVGGMTIAGQKFSYGPDGFTAVGKNTPIPGIPTSVAGPAQDARCRHRGAQAGDHQERLDGHGHLPRRFGSRWTPSRCVPSCRSCRWTTGQRASADLPVRPICSRDCCCR